MFALLFVVLPTSHPLFPVLVYCLSPSEMSVIGKLFSYHRTSDGEKHEVLINLTDGRVCVYQ